MPSFTAESRPVLGHYAWHWLARIHARRFGGHVAVVRHRPTTAGLSALTRERHFLIDTTPQTTDTQVPLPPAPFQARELVLTVEWWISGPHLLLSAAPGDARRQLEYHVTRTVRHLSQAVQNEEILVIRHHVEHHLRDTRTTTTGLAWRLTGIHANAPAPPRQWRRELDTRPHRKPGGKARKRPVLLTPIRRKPRPR